MNPRASPASRSRGPLAAALLVAAVLLGVGVWLVRERTEERAIDDALASYAADPLPSPGSPIDTTLAALGARVFLKRCSGCHAITAASRMGPDLAGVTFRRSYAWMRAMMLAPDSMTAHDSVAVALKRRYKVQMLLPGGVSAAQARAVIEFLRRVDAGLEG